MNFHADETLYYKYTQFNVTNFEVCFSAPSRILSDGIWSCQDIGRTPMKSFFPVFELQVLIIFAITQICRFLIKPLGLPIFISHMMAGLILAGSFEVAPFDSYLKKLFPFGTHDIISTISSIGLVLFIFINGVQMELSIIATRNKAWAIGMVAPILLGLASSALLPNNSSENDNYVTLVLHSLTSFPVIASLLNDLKMQNSELGRLALSAGLVSDGGTTIVGKIGATVMMTHEVRALAKNLSYLFAIVILIPIIFRPVMVWIINRTPEGRPVKHIYIYVIMSMVFLLGKVSVMLHQEFVLGAFILGLTVPDGPPLGSALVKKLKFFGNTFLLPIFVTTAMLRADIKMDYSSPTVLTIVLIILVTHFTKMMATFLVAFFCQMPVIDAFTLALILNTKGIVEIAALSSFYDNNLIGSKTYALMMISVMVVASIVQLSVKFLYDPSRKFAGYHKRNMVSLRPNSELRILMAIHKPHHISPSIGFLDICNPTTEQPITVDALHLIDLVGRVFPIFITNCLQKQTSSRTSYSDNVILALDMFQHDNQDAVSVFTYTAISPPSLMFENICTLALDKAACIIILHFHQRWSSDGEVESDEKNLRSLNCKVLDTAPCTVGILVTRASPLRTHPCTKLAIIYLGGADDEEVLCLAMRATVNPNISIVVYHLVVKNDIEELEDLMAMEHVLLLQAVKHAQNVKYEEVPVKGGSDTTDFLRDIVLAHDFFIVGRRHGIKTPQTSGLENWSEFPELGAIGDFLSSPNFKSDASVLVVQQQLSH